MCNSKKTGFHTLILICFCVLACLTACNSKESDRQPAENFSKDSEKASLLLVTNPHASIQLIDSLVQAITPEALADTQLVAYFELKANALVKLNMRDSAYSFVKRFQAILTREEAML
jgi:hypothetical protein